MPILPPECRTPYPSLLLPPAVQSALDGFRVCIFAYGQVPLRPGPARAGMEAWLAMLVSHGDPDLSHVVPGSPRPSPAFLLGAAGAWEQTGPGAGAGPQRTGRQWLDGRAAQAQTQTARGMRQTPGPTAGCSAGEEEHKACS